MPLKDIHTHSHAINPNLNLTFGLNTSSAIQIQRNLNEMHCKTLQTSKFPVGLARNSWAPRSLGRETGKPTFLDPGDMTWGVRLGGATIRKFGTSNFVQHNKMPEM